MLTIRILHSWVEVYLCDNYLRHLIIFWFKSRPKRGSGGWIDSKIGSLLVLKQLICIWFHVSIPYGLWRHKNKNLNDSDRKKKEEKFDPMNIYVLKSQKRLYSQERLQFGVYGIIYAISLRPEVHFEVIVPYIFK